MIWKQNCGLFYYFNFERNYDVWKSRSLCILLNTIINFNKNETESKMENPTHSFGETNLALQLIWESQIKVKLWLVWACKKRGHFLYCLFCQKGFFFKIGASSQYIRVLNTISEYKYFYISKNITSYTFVACF